MLLARAGADLIFAALDFAAVLDVDFFSMVGAATAGHPHDEEGYEMLTLQPPFSAAI